MAGDQQILSSDSSGAPKEYVIPASQELLLKACYAEYDGSSTSSTWYPVLEIISDAGDVAASIPMDNTVNAGTSVAATWGPFLRTSTSSATTSGALGDVATCIGTVSLGNGVGDPTGGANMSNTIATTNTSIFEPGSVFLQNGIAIVSPGTYYISARSYGTTTTAPAANAILSMQIESTTLQPSDYRLQLAGVPYAVWVYNPAYTTYYAFASFAWVWTVGNPPEVCSLAIGQNTGHSVDVVSALYIQQLTTKYL